MTYVTRQLQPQDLFFFLLVNKIQVGKVKQKKILILESPWKEKVFRALLKLGQTSGDNQVHRATLYSIKKALQETTAPWLLFEWPNFKISSLDSKVRTTLYTIVHNKQ